MRPSMPSSAISICLLPGSVRLKRRNRPTTAAGAVVLEGVTDDGLKKVPPLGAPPWLEGEPENGAGGRTPARSKGDDRPEGSSAGSRRKD